MGIATNDISTIEVSRPAPRRSFALAVGLAALVSGLAYLAMFAIGMSQANYH